MKSSHKKTGIKVNKGGLHKALGKEPKAPITEKEINNAMKSPDPKVRKMAVFAKNARKWDHSEKDATKK